MKNFLLLILTVFFFSCQKKENAKTFDSTSDSIVVKENEISKKENEENKQIGDTIFMKLKDDRNVYVAKGILDSVHSRVYVKFNSEDIGELNAKIIPSTGKGNIRFNQIIFPDQTSDGPFGMDLKTPLKQKGNYILIIGHSQMADNPYYGDFEVQVENKKGTE
ncbi:hypothetical protein [Flavobacterium sp. KACC 22761]|uniref:hypothetical protein n=1 Tax=Flavobacterium sp. KACC 22761 TaxID=3092665 RepID=UPI002A764DA4|nr:hypothetical protein [Flavobacterium sp. KACC 22761]WPO77875.1 hypothetical protein SCB73_16515 [Flavobacterium sp. KACC 22761]